MLLELLLEGALEGAFTVVSEALFVPRERRTGPQWAALFVGVLLVLGAIGIGVAIGLWYGLAVAAVGVPLALYGF